jgi:MFS family permease
MFAFGMQGIYFHVVPLLSNAGFSTHTAGVAFGATWLLSGLGSLGLGLLADRIGPKVTLASALVCCAVGTLLLLGAGQSIIGVICAVGFIVLWGLSLNCFGQLAPVIFAARVGSRRLGTLIGWQFASAGVAGAISPVVTGMMYDKFGGYAAAIDLNSVTVFAAVGLILMLKASTEQADLHACPEVTTENLISDRRI